MPLPAEMALSFRPFYIPYWYYRKSDTLLPTFWTRVAEGKNIVYYNTITNSSQKVIFSVYFTPHSSLTLAYLLYTICY